jgi:branched-chain amino acid transport system ATP-binding protein
MRTPILETKGLTKEFGEFRAVDRVDFVLEQGALESIIGPNGAGKTTFFNLLTGKLRASEGAIHFNGTDITRWSPQQIIQLGLVRSFQISSLFSELSVFENIMLPMIARYGRETSFFPLTRNQKDIQKEAWHVLERIGLEKQAELGVDSLSHGDRRRLDIGIALARQFNVLLLDEPTAGLNPEETKSMVELIKRFHEDEKKTILFIEHNVSVVLGISQRITVLRQGRVIANGTPEEVQQNKAVREAYLGEETDHVGS